VSEEVALPTQVNSGAQDTLDLFGSRQIIAAMFDNQLNNLRWASLRAPLSNEPNSRSYAA
jgi:hypothetical protein